MERNTNETQIAAPDVQLNTSKKKGITIITDNNFFTRIWFFISKL